MGSGANQLSLYEVFHVYHSISHRRRVPAAPVGAIGATRCPVPAIARCAGSGLCRSPDPIGHAPRSAASRFASGVEWPSGLAVGRDGVLGRRAPVDGLELSGAG